MKTMMNPTQTIMNKRGSAWKWTSAIVCFAFMVAGISAFAAPPANDNFANATVIPASPPATVNGNNTEATFESGEPAHSDWSEVAKRGTNSVWWVWTPSSSAATTIDTINSGFDTELAVYTGGAVGSLNQVAVNEDGDSLANGWSKVTFNAVSGTTYHIAVAGFENINGAVALNFSSGTTNPPPTGLVLTVIVNPPETGTVTRNPAQPAGGYDTNAVVVLTATPASGTTNEFIGWSGDIGTNSATANPITITMDDNKTISAAFTGNGGGGVNCGESTSIIVSTNGNGRVTPNLNGRDNLVVCRNYRLNAQPARDWIFAGWTGVSSNENNPRLSFTMQPGMVITANFVPNPFLPVTGTYNGLFFDTNVTTSCSGGFTIRVQKTGRYSATFSSAGQRARASGTFDSNGHADGTAGRGTNLLTYSLQLSGLASGDVAEGAIINSDKITGTVTTSEGCIAQLEGDRQVFTKQDPAPLQGIYTFVLPRNATSGTQTNDVISTNIVVMTNNPGASNEMVVTNTTFETNTVITSGEDVINPGHSFGTLTIDKTGRARIRGELADGSRFNQSTTISKDLFNGTGQVPLYVSLYRGAGMLIGWLNVSSNDVSGTVNWERPGGALIFPEGFDADIEVIGSPFDRTITPSINILNGIVEIGGNSFEANSAEPLMIPVQMSRRNSLTGDNVSLRLIPNGTVRGTFTSSVTQRNTQLTGVVLQNRNEAYGYFSRSGARGYFEVHSTTAPPQAAVNLGAADDFAVLAGSTVANTGLTTVNGDLGVSAGSAVTGFPPGIVNGNQHVADTTAAQAQLDLTTAFNDAAGRTVAPVSVAGNIGGRTLPPGLYKSTSSLSISSGDLTLDAQGDANAVWIFQIASTLTTTAGRQVILSGGAKASNIFWQVGTSATLGTTTAFKGTIMADQAITLNTGATLDGRALARIASVTLDANTVTKPAP